MNYLQKKGFKRKNLNYKKVGDTYCYVLGVENLI